MFHEVISDEYTSQTLSDLTQHTCRRTLLQHKYDWYSPSDIPDFGFGNAAEKSVFFQLGCASNRSVNFVAMDSHHAHGFSDAFGVKTEPEDASVFMVDTLVRLHSNIQINRISLECILYYVVYIT